jgi:thiaminase
MVSIIGTPEGVYNKWYKLYTEEEYLIVLENLDDLINQFSGMKLLQNLNC